MWKKKTKSYYTPNENNNNQQTDTDKFEHVLFVFFFFSLVAVVYRSAYIEHEKGIQLSPPHTNNNLWKKSREQKRLRDTIQIVATKIDVFFFIFFFFIFRPIVKLWTDKNRHFDTRTGASEKKKIKIEVHATNAIVPYSIEYIGSKNNLIIRFAI